MKKTLSAALLLAGIIGMILVSGEQDNQRESAGGKICIKEDAYFYQDNLPPEAYAILYPVDGPGVMRDKNGEITAIEDLPDPGSNNHPTETPIMHWMEQSLTGQSPPVLYWPAPSLRKSITHSSDTGQPCSSKIATVSEPGIIAALGAALLAIAVIRRKKKTGHPGDGASL